MKNFRKAMSIMLSVIIIATMFAGCGNKTKNTTLSKYLSNGETIWYVVHCDEYASISKDSEVTGIIVFYDNGTFIEADVDETLGAVESMEDSEIIEMVKQKNSEYITKRTDTFLNEIKNNLCPIYTVEEWEKYLEDFFNSYYEIYKPDGESPFNAGNVNFFLNLSEVEVNEFTDDISIWNKYKEIIVDNVLDCYSTQDYKATANNIYNELTQYIESTQIYKDSIAKIQEFIKNPVLEYKLVVNTDGTGNYVKDESIVMQYLSSNTTEMSIKSETLELFTTANATSEYYSNCYEIYDSYYAGFYAMESDDAQLLTRVNKKINFIYDELGTENTTTDNSDTVFEKITLFKFDN